MPIRVLLIEDNPGDVRLIQFALEQSGVAADFEVIRAGDEALHRIDGVPCADIVLLDLNLPAATGFDILQALVKRRAWTNIPVIVVTSSERHQDKNRARKLGAKHFFLKPATLSSFYGLAA
jgi:CheY-like chemotaxis protein